MNEWKPLTQDPSCHWVFLTDFKDVWLHGMEESGFARFSSYFIDTHAWTEAEINYPSVPPKPPTGG